MPSRASPAPELINSSNLSRNELISPDPRQDPGETFNQNYMPIINTVFEDVIAEDEENDHETELSKPEDSQGGRTSPDYAN